MESCSVKAQTKNGHLVILWDSSGTTCSKDRGKGKARGGGGASDGGGEGAAVAEDGTDYSSDYSADYSAAAHCPHPCPPMPCNPCNPCNYDCSGWPYAKCTMSIEYQFGAASAECIAPYHHEKRHIKFSNYPECKPPPYGCERCDDVCARRDGKRSRFDYGSPCQPPTCPPPPCQPPSCCHPPCPPRPSHKGHCNYECSGWPYVECKMEFKSQFESGHATCISPYDHKHGHRPIKISNYPWCADFHYDCERCDDVCAKRDGRGNRFGYH